MARTGRPTGTGKKPWVALRNTELSPLGRRVCVRCETEKGIAEFSANKKNIDGIHTWCHTCAQYSAWVSNDRKRRGEEAPTPPLSEYQKMRELVMAGAQVCTICKNPLKAGKGGFAVDHDHSTGKIRGLLCQPCNTALGLFRDSTTILEQAKNYLIAAKETSDELLDLHRTKYEVVRSTSCAD